MLNALSQELFGVLTTILKLFAILLAVYQLSLIFSYIFSFSVLYISTGCILFSSERDDLYRNNLF
jgi:hypothetical protein